MNDDPETRLLLEQGRLSQTCPSCGTHEMAGFCCTACGRATGPADWVRESRPERAPKSAGKRPVDVTGAAKRVAAVSVSALSLWGAR